MATSSAEFECVFVTETDTAHTDTDMIDGVQNVTVDRSVAMAERTAQGHKVATFVPGVTSIAISIDGIIEKGSAPYEVLKTAFDEKSMVYVTIIEDSTATAGQQGKRYGVYVEASSATARDVDLFVGLDDNGDGQVQESEERCASSSAVASERCVVAFAGESAKRAWILIQNFSPSASGAT